MAFVATAVAASKTISRFPASRFLTLGSSPYIGCADFHAAASVILPSTSLSKNGFLETSSSGTVPQRCIHVPKWRQGRPAARPNRGEKYGRQWRARQGLPNVLDETGPLAELPDWSFVEDGRPGPLSKKQTAKVNEQQRLARDVLSGLQYIKFLQERPQRLQAEAEANQRAITETKLKAKAHRLGGETN